MTPPDKRSELIDRMADFVLANGLAAASLRPLAASAGISDRMLLYHFKDKAAVITAILDCLSGRLDAAAQASDLPKAQPPGQVRTRIARLMQSDAMWPYMCLRVELAARAARADALCQSAASAMADHLITCIAAQTESRDRAEAARILGQVDGRIVLKMAGH